MLQKKEKTGGALGQAASLAWGRLPKRRDLSQPMPISFQLDHQEPRAAATRFVDKHKPTSSPRSEDQCPGGNSASERCLDCQTHEALFLKNFARRSLSDV